MKRATRKKTAMTVRSWRWSLAVGALAVVLVVQAGSHAVAQELKIWRHGVVEAKSDAGFAFMASKGGFAEKQGIKLDMLQFKGDALALRAMLAGELDSYEGSPGGPLIAASRGADIKILGCYWPFLTNTIFVKSSINSPKDLKGKSFAISSPGALPDLFARAILLQNDIRAEDVKFAVMGSDADRFRALSAGLVDAAVVSVEFEPRAEAAGLKVLLRPHETVPNYLRFCIYSTSKTVAQRGDDMVRFLASEITALRFALANRDKALELTREITGAKADDPRPGYIYDEVKRYHAIDPDMPVPIEKLNWMQDLLVKTGNMAKPFDLKPMIVDGPLAKALERVGK
jgi:NitT/TauT family transport system substrate-binding protein